MTTKVTIVVSNGSHPVDVFIEQKSSEGWLRTKNPVQRISTGGVHQEWVHSAQRLVIEEVAKTEFYADNYQFKEPAPHSETKVLQ